MWEGQVEAGETEEKVRKARALLRLEEGEMVATGGCRAFLIPSGISDVAMMSLLMGLESLTSDLR